MQTLTVADVENALECEGDVRSALSSPEYTVKKRPCYHTFSTSVADEVSSEKGFHSSHTHHISFIHDCHFHLRKVVADLSLRSFFLLFHNHPHNLHPGFLRRLLFA